MVKISNRDIERILSVKNVDAGLCVLAINSLMERALREKYNTKNSTFGKLINDYVDEYKLKYGVQNIYNPDEVFIPNKEKRNIYKILLSIYRNHELSNEVRHEFAEINEEGLQVTINGLLGFAAAEGWSELQIIQKLKAELDNWTNHENYQSEDLKKAIKQIETLKKENENLVQKANEYNDLKNRLEIISQEENLLKIRLNEAEDRLSKKDQKLDKVRREANEQYVKFRQEKAEIEKNLKDYEEIKEYLSYLERVSFYTRTRHDYEQTIISLTREQKDVLNQISLNHDFLIKGAAGTGKSLVLIKALEKAVSDLHSELDFGNKNQISGARDFRMLTYTNCLVKYNVYVTQLLQTEIPEDYITTADSFLYSMLKRFFPNKDLCYDLEDELLPYFEGFGFTETELFTEANENIWANCIEEDFYLKNDSSGMKLTLKKGQKAKMWKAINTLEEKLEDCKKWPRNFACKKICKAMEEERSKGKEDFCAEYSFIDEAQDLPPVMLAMIKISTKRAVFLAGDNDQSIYRKGFNWSKSGIDIRGRTRILKTNFRNTIQIHEYAENYRNSLLSKDDTTTPEAFRPGPPVEHSLCKNTDDAISQIVQQVKLLMNILDYEEENICIISNATKKLKNIKDKLDKELGVESVLLSDREFDFSSSKGVRLCNMQNCKGLDFPVVLFLADHRIQGSEDNSIYDSDTYYTQQYNMVYVALTRAMEMLHVYTVENGSFEPFKKLV